MNWNGPSASASGAMSMWVSARTGNPVTTPGDIRNVTAVFRRGLGYDPAKLTEAIKGLVGLR